MSAERANWLANTSVLKVENLRKGIVSTTSNSGVDTSDRTDENPKSEYRNPKRLKFLNFKILNLFRVSDLEFRAYPLYNLNPQR